ncbi:hypothetical protein HYT23_03675 [Candidatus Pacearchaeota archaeon]|nr:hypothetical protein [Candidatus Pacearchaeota archaeon]
MLFYKKNNCSHIGNSKAQGSVEFLMLFGAAMFFFILFLGVIQTNIQDKNKEKERLIVQNIALGAQNEISIAAESTDGYYRNFSIPENILGKDYGISNGNEYLNISLGKFAVFYKIPPINGEIKKGINAIKKENGQVYLNS